MKTIKLTVAQALIKFLKNQYVERDGKENKFFAGCFGIFGHGNVAGIGEALLQNPDFTYYQTRNEQAMVHTAAAFAKMNNRMQTFACTTSIGPGATNMITAVAGATINNLPVLLLPGDTFSERIQSPVLQQLESASTQDISVNDCFKPVSKYWDRIHRPEQLITSLPEVMRVLTSQAETGAATLALPQDVQTEAFNYPVEFFAKRIWTVSRPRADKELLKKAVELIKKSKSPFIVCGGGVIYSDANETLQNFVRQTGIPVGETFAGKGALSHDEKLNLGGVGATGTPCANDFAGKADLVIGIGTRYSDFTTASKTIFRNTDIKFININIKEFDAFKHSALPLTGDAKIILEELTEMLESFNTAETYQQSAVAAKVKWHNEIFEITKVHDTVPVTQAEVIGIVNNFMDNDDVMVAAAGSLPGDLHKLWRSYSSKNFHLEYGYSCMGYEIAAGLGVKMAAPKKEVYVLVGDGNYLMMSNEIITSVQEGYKIIVVLLNNNGYASIGSLSESVGCGRFGTKYRFRDKEKNTLQGEILPVNFLENAKSLGANAFKAESCKDLLECLHKAKVDDKTSVIVIDTDLYSKMKSYAWWDVAVPEVSEIESVKDARKKYIEEKKNQKYYL